MHIGIKAKGFCATPISARATSRLGGHKMTELYRPVTISRRPPRPARRGLRGQVVAQELKGSAFNILFSASFFGGFVYVMLHFG
jgi:hypothetical protein